MFSQSISPTKEKIYRAAATMFAVRGYENVSMRDLAKAVGIKHSSIYNHFETKKDILLDLYKTYGQQRKSVVPNLNTLLKLAETLPPIEVLLMTGCPFDPNIEEIMHCILTTAVICMSTDSESRNFVVENVFDIVTDYVIPVLTKMVECGRIEPVNLKMIDLILLHYCLGAVVLSATPLRMHVKDWSSSLEYIYSSLVKPLV